ncbi:MAG: ribosome biogenesis/translation initiation ATPase RLI [Candidatus Nanoarchaeia archaeon]|nr:ribosome biogenesis/translation initiation ATPase RLI [Candidatus Nanoarchaeia archaeon]
MRIVVVDKKKCAAPRSCDYICMKFCPINRSEKDCIIKSKDDKIEIIEENCIGCGICVKKCAFDAIKIVNLPKELEKKELHSYGLNSFRLFNLIIPAKGHVTGLIGVNGIGKTTCLNILSGQMIPNFGDFKSPADGQKAIDFFKGSEGQNYFENLYAKGVETSYKPQHIERIPKAFKGSVRELLESFSKDYKSIAKEFELLKLLDKKVDEISGGELQRAAIAASLAKESQLLFIDEPSSYLDIKQRLKISNIIREKGALKDSCVVVEHDLVMLDYLAELGNIAYGKSGAYGIISSQLSIREAINTFLEGYIKEDNMRFRENEIRFEVRAPVKSFSNIPLTSWNKINKKIGNFELTINPGSLMKNEIVGILGENGIGKTTYAKILSSMIKPDSGKIDSALKISYKPQYIIVKEDNLVRAHLIKCPNSLIERLDLSHLLSRNLSELSGGELQRVAIAECLSMEADLYLLDEPSAHLDAEQRLNVAKIIKDAVKKKEASAFVIDHDILFMDYLSDRLMVFSGTPGVKGETQGPLDMRKGMNLFLKELNITFRRDKDTKRPRANKPESQADKEQKRKGEYYYQ